MIVGVNGPAGAGKDTIASILVSNYGYIRIGFADSLKESVYSINPIVSDCNRLQGLVDKLGWDEAKRTFPEIRRVLQATGVGLREVVGDNVWVNLVREKITKAQAEGIKDFVIPDLRFPNEAEVIRNLGGTCIRVERPNNPDAIPANHVSEQLTLDTPFIIINSGTIEELTEKVDIVWQEINRGTS